MPLAACCESIRHAVLKNSGGVRGENQIWKRGKDPHPQDKIQHLDFTKDTRPLYYKTPP